MSREPWRCGECGRENDFGALDCSLCGLQRGPAPLPDGGERLAAREAVLHAASIFHPQKDAQLVEALHNAAALLTESSAPASGGVRERAEKVPDDFDPHPLYGPCDGFAHGACSECRQIIYEGRAENEVLRAALSSAPTRATASGRLAPPPATIRDADKIAPRPDGGGRTDA